MSLPAGAPSGDVACADEHDNPARNVNELVAQARSTLEQLEQQAAQDKVRQEAKKERIGSLLLAALVDAEATKTEESIVELERVVEVAQKAGVASDLRVQARKFVAGQRQGNKHAERAEHDLKRLMKQVARTTNVTVSPERLPPEMVELQGSQHDAQKAGASPHRRDQLLMQQFERALADAVRVGVKGSVIEAAKELLGKLKRSRRTDEIAATKLRGLLTVNDPGALGDKFQVVRERSDRMSDGTQKLVREIEDRINRMAKHEQHQQWLKAELASAAQRSDALRLRQLADQAKILDLTVAPDILSLLHDLEHSQSSPSMSARSGKHNDRISSFTARQEEAATSVLNDAEDEPSLEEFNFAQQAIANAKQAKVSPDVISSLEKRLAALEQQHGPRLRAEEQLQSLLHTAEIPRMPCIRGAVIMPDGASVELLRGALGEAERSGADRKLVAIGTELLERSIATEKMQRDAENMLREMLARPMRSSADVELLQEAVEDGKNCGIPTLHAERKLAWLRDGQVHREAAEAELLEASKGTGPQGRARLEAAVKDAKSVGVSAGKLRAANERLTQLVNHEQRCALQAGNIRRALPLIHSEPWRLQQLLENVSGLQPWTAELERLVSTGWQRLDRTVKTQSKQHDTERELRSLLQQVRGGGAPAGGIKALSQLLERARKAAVQDDLLHEAEKELQRLRRESCQRSVAENRLRLAINAKDLGEIERSVGQLRAVGYLDSGGDGAHASGNTARGDRLERPQSARLMDAANSMMKHLSDAASRKQAATMALKQHLSSRADCPPLLDGSRSDSPAGVRPGSQKSRDWFKEVSEILNEAKQSGVAPTLIEHAKLKVKEKRRECNEQMEACQALQRTLSKKDVPTQEFFRHLQKVQRFQSVQ